MELEELGYLFKNDPTFDYLFNNLPKSCFMKIVERRRERLKANPHLSDIL